MSVSSPATYRPVTGGPETLARMQDVIRAAWRRDGIRVPVHPADPEWWLASMEPGTHRWDRVAVWETAEGTAVGWSWHLLPGELEWHALGGHDVRELRRQMLDWLEARVRTSSPTAQKLECWSTSAEPESAALLAAAGWRHGSMSLVHRVADLSGGDPLERAVQRPLPEGFAVRAVGDGEVAARVEVHRAAFAPSRLSVEKYAQVMRSSLYDPELDLVAVAPDGTFASFALVWHDAAIGVGLFEPVGTDPRYQRRGLASAVLGDGLRRLRARGATTAIVLADAREEGPNRLYESVGFHETMRSQRWERPLDVVPEGGVSSFALRATGVRGGAGRDGACRE